MQYINCLIGFAVIVTLLNTVECRSPKKEIKKPHQFKTSITDFSFDFLRALHESESSAGNLQKNLVFSPSNIFRAFLLLSLGTNGDSRVQLTEALHLKKVANVNEGYKTWKGLHVPGVLEADRLYHDTSVDIKQQIKNLLTEDIHKVEMCDASTLEEINQWVSNVTQENIPELLSESLEDVKLLLLSVVYMRAEWKQIFNKEFTKKENFETKDGIKMVDMMFLNQDLKYFKSSSLKSQVVSLPYKDSPLSFLVFLPNVTAGQTIDKLISSLDRKQVKYAVDNMPTENVNVRIPKFKIENQIDLIPLLKALRVVDVFSHQADLSGFTDTNLYVKKALHKVVLEVDEKGTTATAATAVFGARFGGSYPEDFRADHPFVYMVYDRDSEMPLFIGVMMDPTQ